MAAMVKFAPATATAMTPTRRKIERTSLPTWIKPQLSRLVTKAPDGPAWAHEIKYDGYRMHARLDHGRVKLLTRTGLDWTTKYPTISGSFAALRADTAYLDGELCGVRPDGTTSFAMTQNASDGGNAASLVFYLFDLLHLDGKPIDALPLLERKRELGRLLGGAPDCLRYSDHHVGQGPAFLEQARKLSVEGIPRGSTHRMRPAIAVYG
jgi:ATP-dependent DNA ligase